MMYGYGLDFIIDVGDIFDGVGGNDMIYGGDGDDIIYGGVDSD